MRITETEKNTYANIWVIAELNDGDIQQVTFELLAEARKLASVRKSELWCVALGNGIRDKVQPLFHHGADTVLVAEDPSLKDFVDETEAETVCRLVEKYKPETVLAASTSRGRALMPRVAARLVTGLTTDCTAFSVDPATGNLLMKKRPASGGNVDTVSVCAQHRPQLATVRPRVMSAGQGDVSRTGKVVLEAAVLAQATAHKKVLRTVKDASNTAKLADAQFIVAGGRGMKGPEGFVLLKELAAALGGALGASRAAVDAGWVPYTAQVGQTGQTVQPKVYIACGISGQTQHLVGMQSSDFIVAVNKDPDAPIMKLADIAVVGDAFEIIPALAAELLKT